MTLADKVTSIRLVLAPVFFIIYLLPQFFHLDFSIIPSTGSPGPLFVGAPWTVPALWIIFVLSEITDFLDGAIARKRGEVSDFGKFFDPFADTLTQVTYFFCFVMDRILPPLLFLAVLYREFSILFIRNLMLKKGVSLGARMAGKVKTVTYVLAGALALMASSMVRLGMDASLYRGFAVAAVVVFVVSVLISIISFFDYVSVYNKTQEKK